MYAIKRELQLNNKEVSQMRGMAGFKRLVYNLGLELLWYNLRDAADNKTGENQAQ